MNACKAAQPGIAQAADTASPACYPGHYTAGCQYAAIALSLGSPQLSSDIWLRALQAVITLQTQYRMAADIQSLANELVYCGRLRCGSPQQEASMLHLPLRPQQRPQQAGWLALVSNKLASKCDA